MKLLVKNLRKFLQLAEERQCIYIKKEGGEPWLWTKDPIFQRFRFCNFYRQQDRETKWLVENWCKPYANHPNLWFAICMFRQINWSPTLAFLGFPEEWNPKRTLKRLENRFERGEKVYTSAYLIPSRGEEKKVRYTVLRVLNPLWKDVQKMPDQLPWNWNRDFERGECGGITLKEAHEWLMQFYGWGPFLAYEAVTDLRHTRYLRNATDIYIWANPGPGAKRGICRLLGVDIKTTISKQDQLQYMQEIYGWVLIERNMNILPTLEMRDIEHWCCEYSKYTRTLEQLKSGKTIGQELYRRPGIV